MYMNKQEFDILNVLGEGSCSGQRLLAERSGHSLGVVNRAVRSLTEQGYLNGAMEPTEKAKALFAERAPRSAVILAAGFGMRMVPINTETPKGLLEVHGERLIERIICQLHEVGVQRIYVVVGFMKEQYEYLMDEFGVELVVNRDYASKNNLHSIELVRDKLANAYIIPCDIWCRQNPFRSRELYSWYMVSDRLEEGSEVRVNRKMELVSVPANGVGNTMLGICYLLEEEAAIVGETIRRMGKDARHDGDFWERALFQKDRMLVQARVVPAETVVEIDTFEQLRELDGDSSHLQNRAIAVAAGVMDVTEQEITGITVLKKGMTNRSFLFDCRGKKYIMRIPGEGTDQMINRREEAAVYRALEGRGICDDVLYISPENGYKITAFLDDARVCDPLSASDIRRCMEKLRSFHEQKLRVEHAFDIFERIGYYESLRGGPSVYKDYEKTKANVLSLKPFVEAHREEAVLTHIDAVPDNFLFVRDTDGEEHIRLIDWEYAGMQDPHVDIAMFCIYALYDRWQIDRLIGFYFPEGCDSATRIKIYCYVAACGLLWSNWCEYKSRLGVEFGEYSLRQYRFAKDYYRIAREAIGAWEESHA